MTAADTQYPAVVDKTHTHTHADMHRQIEMVLDTDFVVVIKEADT